MIRPINKIIFFIVSYLIFIRLIMVHLPKELLCTSANFPYYLFTLCLLLCILIFKIYLHFFYVKTSENFWVHKVKNLEVYSEYYYTLFKKCHQYLIDNISYNDTILNFLLKAVIKHYLTLRIIYFGLTYGPKYILGLTFFFETFIVHKLNLFYSFLPLLFIPLLCQYMLFAINNFVETNLEYLDNCIEIEVILTETKKYKTTANFYNEYILSLTPDEDFKAFINLDERSQEYLKTQDRDIVEETKLLVDLFYSLVNFNILWTYLNKLKLKYNFYVQLGITILYIISWIYIIFFTGEGSSEFLKLIKQLLVVISKEEPFSGMGLD